MTHQYIPKGFGYYDTTHYPVGGAFRRASSDTGILEIIRTFPKYSGCNAEVRLITGKTAAVNMEFVKTN